MISIDTIKQLREETGVSVIEVKKALEEAQGDMVKAKELLRSLGKKMSDKKISRETNAGMIDYYVHPNLKTGVLLDIRCESDFVAQSPDFKQLSHEVCLQIVAMKPLFVKEADVPQELLDTETKIYKAQLADSGKSESMVAQILEGKLKKYQESVCLLSQAWIKDDSKTVKNLVEEAVSKLGENIEIKRFVCYEM